MFRLSGKQLTALIAVILGLVVVLGGLVRLTAGGGIGGHAPPGVVADHGQIVTGPIARLPVGRSIDLAPVLGGGVPAALPVAVVFLWCLARRGGSRLSSGLVRRQRGRSPPGIPIS